MSSNCHPTNILLKQWMPSHSSALNVFHVNARSLPKHIFELRAITENLNMHVLGVSETWLVQNKHTDKSVELPGFKLIKNNRGNGRAGGGVCLYINKSIKTKVVCQSTSSSETEYLFVEAHLNKKKIIIGVVYRNPAVSGVNELDECLMELFSETAYSDIIIMGDYNINTLVDSTNLRSLKNTLNVLNMDIYTPTVTIPTHQTSTNSSLLDYFIIQNKLCVTKYFQNPVPGIADHDLIGISYKMCLPKLTPKQIFRRNLKNVRLHDLLDEADNFDWNQIHLSTDVEHKIDVLNSLLQKLLDKYAPLKKVKVIYEECVWLTEQIVDQIKIRDVLFNAWRNQKSQLNKDLFHKQRNKVNQMISDAKKFHFNTQLNLSLPGRKLWKNLSNLGLRPASESTSNFSPDDHNNFFSNSSTQNSSTPRLSPTNNPRNITEFAFKCVDMNDVDLAFQRLKSDAEGCDGLSLRFIKILLPAILPHLTEIFNYILTSSSYPTK